MADWANVLEPHYEVAERMLNVHQIPVEQVPKNAAEKETLVGFLDANRAVMTWKLEGMDDAAARVAPFASDTSMIGMIQHLTVVEKSRFEAILLASAMTIAV